MAKYQPGGRRERAALLSQIAQPECCWTEEQALEAVRAWKRKIERAKELKVIIPDPSIMLSALDIMAEKVLKKDQRRSKSPLTQAQGCKNYSTEGYQAENTKQTISKVHSRSDI